MAKFDPKKAGRRCLPEGVYEATVSKTEQKESKNTGAPMLAVELTVYHGDAEVKVRDYIMVDPEHQMFWRFRQLVIAAAGQEAWDTGDTDQCELAVQGCNLSVELKVESDEQYGDQNKVWKYLPLQRATGTPPRTPTPAAEKPGQGAPSVIGKTGPLGEEDIPF